MCYHIVKSKKKGHCYVVLTGDNGEVLSQTEDFTRKENAFKNIISQMGRIYSDTDADYYVSVQDEIESKVKLYTLYDTGRKKLRGKQEHMEIYIPGKNKSSPKKKNKTPSQLFAG